jgi:hypothetical protein
MVVQYRIILLCLKTINILIKDWLKLFDVVTIDLKVNEPMKESCLTVSELEIELSILKSHLLQRQDLLNNLLVRKDFILLRTFLVADGFLLDRSTSNTVALRFRVLEWCISFFLRFLLLNLDWSWTKCGWECIVGFKWHKFVNLKPCMVATSRKLMD